MLEDVRTTSQIALQNKPKKLKKQRKSQLIQLHNTGSIYNKSHTEAAVLQSFNGQKKT